MSINQTPDTPQNPPESTIRNWNPKLTRKQLLKGALGLAASAAGIDTAANLAQAINIITSAKEYKNRPPVTRIAKYGNLVKDAQEGKTHMLVSLGDSINYGYSPTAPDNQVETANEFFCSDINQKLGRDDVFVHKNPQDWIMLPSATVGMTTKDVYNQVNEFIDYYKNHPDKSGNLWDISISAGGDDALNYLRSSYETLGAPAQMSTLLSRFQTDFIPNLRNTYIKMLRDIVSFGNQITLEHIFVTGIPDIGKSTLLGFMNLPIMGSKMRELATAICKHMNNAILDAIEQVQTETNVQILFEDIFDIPISDIHPTQDGQRNMATKREKRCMGIFPRDPNPKTFSDALIQP